MSQNARARPTPAMPRLTLSRRIFLAFGVLLVVVLLAFALSTRWSLQRGLGPYVAEIEIRRLDWLAELLKKHYVEHGDWNSLRGDDHAWHRLRMGDLDRVHRPSLGPDRWPGLTPPDAADGHRSLGAVPPLPGDWQAPGGIHPPPPGEPGELSPLRPMPPPGLEHDPLNGPDSIEQRLSLVDATGAWVAGARLGPSAAASRLPLKEEGQVIGTLLLAPPEGLETDADRAFLARQGRFVLWTGVAGVALALLLSWLLARRWFAPVGALTQGAVDIARGRLDTRVVVRGRDELALLGRTFNQMAERLDSIEASRRAWLADVAHELRTPLAAMRAEIEAVQDGVRGFDDRTALRLHRQVMRLGQLVDDLRNSMDGRGDTEPAAEAVLPLVLLREALAIGAERFAAAGLTVHSEGLDMRPQPVLYGQAGRLHQVYLNLIENTLRYTSPGGRLEVQARIEGPANERRLVLQWDDSAPGVEAHELPRLFERLYRGEASRSRVLGGSGLGLSICRTAIEVHGGFIEAAESPLGGVRIRIVLPVEDAEA